MEDNRHILNICGKSLVKKKMCTVASPYLWTCKYDTWATKQIVLPRRYHFAHNFRIFQRRIWMASNVCPEHKWNHFHVGTVRQKLETTIIFMHHNLWQRKPPCQYLQHEYSTSLAKKKNKNVRTYTIPPVSTIFKLSLMWFTNFFPVRPPQKIVSFWNILASLHSSFPFMFKDYK